MSASRQDDDAVLTAYSIFVIVPLNSWTQKMGGGVSRYISSVLIRYIDRPFELLHVKNRSSLQGCYPGLCCVSKHYISHYNFEDSFNIGRVIRVYVILYEIRHLEKWSKIQKRYIYGWGRVVTSFATVGPISHVRIFHLVQKLEGASKACPSSTVVERWKENILPSRDFSCAVADFEKGHNFFMGGAAYFFRGRILRSRTITRAATVHGRRPSWGGCGMDRSSSFWGPWCYPQNFFLFVSASRPMCI